MLSDNVQPSVGVFNPELFQPPVGRSAMVRFPRLWPSSHWLCGGNLCIKLQNTKLSSPRSCKLSLGQCTWWLPSRVSSNPLEYTTQVAQCVLFICETKWDTVDSCRVEFDWTADVKSNCCLCYITIRLKSLQLSTLFYYFSTGDPQLSLFKVHFLQLFHFWMNKNRCSSYSFSSIFLW